MGWMEGWDYNLNHAVVKTILALFAFVLVLVRWCCPHFFSFPDMWADGKSRLCCCDCLWKSHWDQGCCFCLETFQVRTLCLLWIYSSMKKKYWAEERDKISNCMNFIRAGSLFQEIPDTEQTYSTMNNLLNTSLKLSRGQVSKFGVDAKIKQHNHDPITIQERFPRLWITMI